MKLKPSIPTLLAAFIGLAAVSLFLHTEASRKSSAEALRLAKEAAARSSSRHSEADAASAASIGGISDDFPHGAALEKRMNEMLTTANAFDQTRTLLSLLKDFSTEDFTVALDACKKIVEGNHSAEFNRIFAEWCRRDPVAALAYARQDANLKAAVLGIWTSADPEAALRWAKGDAPHDPAGTSLGTVIVALAKKDPWVAMEHLGELSPKFANQAIFAIGQSATPEIAQAMLEWADTVDDPVTRTAAARSIFWSWNEKLPQRQRFDLLKTYPEAAASGWGLGKAFASYGQEDLAAAREAIGLIPTAALKKDAITGLFRDLLEGDNLEATMEVIADHPEIADDTMVADGISQLAYTKPTHALERTSLIKDADKREDTYAQVIANWMESKPEAATTWLESNTVSSRIRERMEKHIAASKKSLKEAYESDQAEASGR